MKITKVVYGITFVLISIVLNCADLKQELSKLFPDPKYLKVEFNPYQQQLRILPSINKRGNVFYNVTSYEYSPSRKFILIYSEERDFVAKYIGIFLGSMQKVMKIFNRELNKAIYEIANAKTYHFNEDESRFFIIATKKSLFRGNDVSYVQLIDTNNGEILLSLDNVKSARFFKEEGFTEKLLITMENDDDEKRYDAITGKPYSVRQPVEESATKQPTLLDRIRSIATKIGGKSLSDFFRLIQNKQKKSLIKQESSRGKKLGGTLEQRKQVLSKEGDEDIKFFDQPEGELEEFIMAQEEALEYGDLTK